METQTDPFQDDPRLVSARQAIATRLEDIRESLRFFPDAEAFSKSEYEKHWSESAFIIGKSGYQIPDRDPLDSDATEFRTRQKVCLDEGKKMKVVTGRTVSKEGTVRDIKAGYYNAQLDENGEPAFAEFGKHPSIVVCARERADGTTAEGTVSDWFIMGWIAFKPNEVIDYRAPAADSFDELIVVRSLPGVDEKVPFNSEEGERIRAAIDKVALACIDTRRLGERLVGAQAVQQTVSEQQAS